MLLDFNRLHQALDRRFPPPPGSPSLLPSVEAAVGQLREGPGARVGDHRDERRRRPVVARDDRLAPGGLRDVRDPLRRVGRGRRADPVPRPVARRDPAGPLRPRRRPGLRALGRAALPRDPPDRRAHRDPEGDGECAAPASVARDLRVARRRRDLRAVRASSSRCRRSPPAARSGSSSATASRSRAGRPGRPCRSRWSSNRPGPRVVDPGSRRLPALRRARRAARDRLRPR